MADCCTLRAHRIRNFAVRLRAVIYSEFCLLDTTNGAGLSSYGLRWTTACVAMDPAALSQYLHVAFLHNKYKQKTRQLAQHCHLRPPVHPVVRGFNHDLRGPELHGPILHQRTNSHYRRMRETGLLIDDSTNFPAVLRASFSRTDLTGACTELYQIWGGHISDHHCTEKFCLYFMCCSISK